MIADAFPCKTVLLFSTSEALFVAVQSDGKICEFLLKAVPTQELNLALASAAVLNVLGDDPELMTHPGE